MNKPMWLYPLGLIVLVALFSPLSIPSSGQEVNNKPKQVSPTAIKFSQNWFLRDYAWLTNDRMIVTRGLDLFDAVDLSMNEQGGLQTTATLPLDLPLGYRSRLNLVAYRALNAPSSNLYISPNHQWLVGQSIRHSHTEIIIEWVAVELATRRVVKWKAASYDNEAIWMPDSQGWLELGPERSGIAIVHRLDTSQKTSSDSLLFQEGAKVPITGISNILGFLGSDHILALGRSPFAARGQITLFECLFNQALSEVTEHHCDFPPHARFADEVISPDGKKLGWLILTQDEKPPDSPPSPLFYYSATVWVSNLQGHDAVKLSEMKIGLLVNITGSRPPEHLQWSPDGKRLSFLYKGQIWITDTAQAGSKAEAKTGKELSY